MNTVTLPHPHKLIVIEPLDYPNVYDIHRPHRHSYFEVMLIETGGGNQFIDFTKYPLQQQEIYTIYPGQVHLLERKESQGLVIQFKKEIFDFLFPLKHHQCYFATPLITMDAFCFKHLYGLTKTISHLLKNDTLTALSIEKVYSYLKIILITLIEHTGNTSFSLEEKNFACSFLSLLEQQVRTHRKVSDYAERMCYSNDKFAALCKSTFGKTPLKLIHEELLMEIRRMIMLDTLTLKEIAFELNFDSQANFSAFIKQTTRKTATELQTEILSIYK